MKLKYYLRGLGVGIVVTAVILTIANHLGNKMSDEDIIKRAAKLGMVMKEDESLFPPTEPETTTPEPTSPSPAEQDTTAVKPAEPETTTDIWDCDSYGNDYCDFRNVFGGCVTETGRSGNSKELA